MKFIKATHADGFEVLINPGAVTHIQPWNGNTAIFFNHPVESYSEYIEVKENLSELWTKINA